MVTTALFFSIFLSLLSLQRAAISDYLPLSTVALDSSTTLAYRFVDQSTVQWSITAQTSGFVALGLKNANNNQYDITWGFVNGSATTVTDSFYNGTSTSDDVSLGGKNDLTTTSGTKNGTTTTLTWRKAINSGDQYDVATAAGQQINVIWAVAKSGAADANALELDFAASGGNVKTGSFTFNKLAWLKADLSLMKLWWYINQGTSEVEFMMEGNTTGYVSFGFGSSMSGADCYVGYMAGANPVVRDTWSSSDVNPPLDTTKGGTDDVYRVLGERIGSQTLIGFTRKMDTGDNRDIVVRSGSMDIIWAISKNNSDALKDHGSNYGSGTLDFYTATLSEDTGLSGREKHGIYLTVAWGFLPPFFRWSFIYLSHNKLWIWIHVLLTILVCVLHWIGLAVLDEGGEDEGSGSADLHESFGSIMAPLAFWLVVTGAGSMYAMKWSKIRIPYIFKSHGWPVYAILVVAFLALLTGFLVVWPKYLWILFVWLAFVLGVEGVLYYYTEHHKRKAHAEQGYPLTMDKPILRTFSNFTEYMAEVHKNPKKRFTLFQNYVIDITGYPTNHPGGAFIFKNILPHDDMGRWIYGGYGLDTHVPPHIHTVAAERDIYQNMIYGSFAIYQDSIQSKSIVVRSNDASLLQEENGENDVDTKRKADAEKKSAAAASRVDQTSWSLHKVVKLTGDTSQFYFDSDTWKCNPRSCELENMGRHFKITKKIGRQYVSRLYTSIFSLNNARVKMRNQDTQRIGNKLGIDNLKTLEPVEDDALDSKLNLVIKHYPVKAKLTPYLFGLPSNPGSKEEFLIEGPGGLGLCLDSNAEGTHAIFGAGTGMLPFIDLFDHCLKQLIAWSDSGEKGNFLSTFKMVVHASYPARDKCCGLVLMEKCQALAKALNYDGFDLNLYFANENKQRFDAAFIQKNKDALQGLSKAYICGPPRFNEELPIHLETLGIGRSKMFFI